MGFLFEWTGGLEVYFTGCAEELASSGVADATGISGLIGTRSGLSSRSWRSEPRGGFLASSSAAPDRDPLDPFGCSSSPAVRAGARSASPRSRSMWSS